MLDVVKRLIKEGVGNSLLPAPPPNSKSAPGSSVSAWGKTPGTITRNGAAGIKGWADYEATDAELAAWFGNEQTDYGVCVLSRALAAVDIDINDATHVAGIVALLPGAASACMRTRPNSARVLIPVRVTGGAELPTRSVYEFAGGAVEILGPGTQWLAHGTHPSGARYALSDAPILELNAAELDVFGAQLINAGFTFRRAQRAAPQTDALLEFLKVRGLIRQLAHDRAYVTCPWAHLHSSDSLTSTAYLRPHTGGHPNASFKCLHAHCVDKTLTQALGAWGYEWPELGGPAPDKSPLTAAAKSTKVTTLSAAVNLVSKLTSASLDTFTERVELDGAPLDDADILRLRMALSSKNYELSRDMARDAICQLATQHKRDSLQAWCDSLTWDGVKRIDSFLSVYAGQPIACAYGVAVSRYLWSGLAARARRGGAKCDMVVVLSGPEGIGKSSLVAALAPFESAFCDVDFSRNDDDITRQLRGVCVAELGELRGMGAKDSAHLLAWVTRTHDDIVPKYQEFSKRRARRFMLIGTTNVTDWLSDSMGRRRWLPVSAKQGQILTRENCAQLWAEACVTWPDARVEYADAEKLANERLNAVRERDAFEDALLGLSSKPTLGEAFAALGISAAQRTSGVRRRVERAIERVFS